MLDVSEKNRIFRVTFLMVILSWASMKIILPALPELHNEFSVEMKDIKLSVAVFLFIISIAQLIWGGLARFYNPRRLILLGLVISLAGSILSMSAVNFEMYFIGRSMEGMGLGCVSPLSRAITANLFDRVAFAGKSAFVAMATAVLPAVSSLAGGHIMALMGWRAIFGFLIFANILVIIFVFKYLRNFPALEKSTGKSGIAAVFESYFEVLKSRIFWGYISPYALILGSLIAYYSASPFWFVNDFAYSGKNFSNFLLPTAASITFGLLLTRRLIQKRNIDKIILWGLITGLFTFFLTLVFWMFNLNGVAIIVTIFTLLGFANGLISPGVNAECLTRLKKHAAPAAALITCYIFVISSVFASITMKMSVLDFSTLVIFIGGVALVSFFAYWFAIYRRAHNS